jgi:hypothetical protein
MVVLWHSIQCGVAYHAACIYGLWLPATGSPPEAVGA